MKDLSQLSEDEEAYIQAKHMKSSVVRTVIMQAAINLDLLEILAKSGPDASLSAVEISSQLPTRNPNAPTMVDRILSALTTYSVVSCSLRVSPDGKPERFYGLTPLCKFLIKNENGGSLSGFARNSFPHWFWLKEAVLEGGDPWSKAYSMSMYEKFSKDPDRGKWFNQIMKQDTLLVMNELLKNYAGFETVTSLIDLGGGTGTAISLIVSKHPNIKGINFDQPNVIKQAPSFPGVEHVGGNIFERIPKADAIFMKTVCHNWGDNKCVKLLKNCYDAIPDDGKMILMDVVLPQVPMNSMKTKIQCLHDANMLLLTREGRERTLQDFEFLAKTAGFHHVRFACPVFDLSVIELLKKP